MSVETRFMFATGLERPMTVPRGTLARLQAHVREVEDRLGLVATKYLENPARWADTKPTKDVTDEVLCGTAQQHNEWVDDLWERLDDWHEKPPTENTEILTSEDAATFWHGTRKIDVPIHRWTRDYCRKRMEEVYEILRGRPTAGFNVASKPLTPEQAGSVIWLIGEYLGINPGQADMAVPKGWCYDRKAKRMKLVQLDEVQPSGSYDGDGYEWCERCGAVDVDSNGETGCPRPRSKCPIKRDRID